MRQSCPDAGRCAEGLLSVAAATNWNKIQEGLNFFKHGLSFLRNGIKMGGQRGKETDTEGKSERRNQRD